MMIKLFLTVPFLIMIFVVGPYQAIVELREKGSIQFLDPIADTFENPIRQADTTAREFDAVRLQIDTISAILSKSGSSQLPVDSLSAPMLENSVDNLVGTVASLKNRITTVNRYVTLKEDNPKVIQFNAISTSVTGLKKSVEGSAAVSDIVNALDMCKKAIAAVSPQYSHPGILTRCILVVKHAFLYTIFDRDYFLPYESSLKSNSLVVKTSRQIIQVFRYIVFSDLGEKAIVGKANWLFYKPGITCLIRPYIYDPRAKTVDPEDDLAKDDVIDTIKAFQQELKRLDIDLLMVMVPGKESVYPDLLSNKLKPSQAGRIGYSLQFLADLKAQGIASVDLYSALGKARMEDGVAGDSLYLSTDSHWKSRGMQVAAKTVADYVKTMPWFTPFPSTDGYVIDTIQAERTGDILAMVDLPAFASGIFNKRYGKENVRCLQVYRVKRDTSGAVIDKKLFADDFQNAQIMVIGDSFSRIFQTDTPRGAGWISLLANDLRAPVGSIINDGGASTLVRETLSRKKNLLKGKKLVIWEFVDRDLRFGANGWRVVKL